MSLIVPKTPDGLHDLDCNCRTCFSRFKTAKKRAAGKGGSLRLLMQKEMEQERLKKQENKPTNKD